MCVCVCATRRLKDKSKSEWVDCKFSQNRERHFKGSLTICRLPKKIHVSFTVTRFDIKKEFCVVWSHPTFAQVLLFKNLNDLVIIFDFLFSLSQ